MVFEANVMPFPCRELLLFNYAKVNTVFHSKATLTVSRCAEYFITLLLPK